VKSRTTRTNWKLFDKLPDDVQQRAKTAFEQWRENPHAAALQFKCVSDREALNSVRVGLRWRALGYRDDAADEVTITWFWIGSHVEYYGLIG
jgi:hypothetical protein